jgi:hypothetical protein
MIAYGKNNKMRFNYTDCHPKRLGKNVVNWWEAEIGYVDKHRARQENKRITTQELNRELYDNY